MKGVKEAPGRSNKEVIKKGKKKKTIEQREEFIEEKEKRE
jgi:hypothetical protein